jgi:hypothetical protein
VCVYVSVVGCACVRVCAGVCVWVWVCVGVCVREWGGCASGGVQLCVAVCAQPRFAQIAKKSIKQGRGTWGPI